MEKDLHNYWNIWVDTGGTFTDCIGIDPGGEQHRVKVLSSSALRGSITSVISSDSIEINKDWEAPDGFLNGFTLRLLKGDEKPVKVKQFDSSSGTVKIAKAVAEDAWAGQSFEVISPEEAPVLAARLITQTPADEQLPPVNLRLATTRGTNALLEHKGAPVGLFITNGFGDLLKIGNQQRPDLFALEIKKPRPLYQTVIEVPERIDAQGEILQPLSLADLENGIEQLIDEGISSAAVVGMNSYRNAAHEQELAEWLSNKGFRYISISSDLSSFVKILPRAQTTLINAYLAPIMESYLNAVQEVVPAGQLLVMTSAGGLLQSSEFTPKDSLLSGPAAGVVGAAAAGKAVGFDKVISFDMGGTSTDVSRYDGDYEYIFEHQVGDARLMAPAVAVETVAAGGGSICWFDGHQLRVGPESAGASPGPACYGAGGPLTVTDINVLAGRLDERNFHIPIDIGAAKEILEEIAAKVSEKEGETVSSQTLIKGFLDIANRRMAEAIEKISLRKGYDPQEYVLVSFGGAGAQHCCAIARQLNVDSIVIPRDAGLLSAYGLGNAVLEHFEEQQLLQRLSEVKSHIGNMMEEVAGRALEKLSQQTSTDDLQVRRELLFLRLKDQESTLEIPYYPDMDISSVFKEAYRTRYGHWVEGATIEVESLRVVASTKPEFGRASSEINTRSDEWTHIDQKEILFGHNNLMTPIFDRSDALPGAQIEGPALILDPYSTILLEPGWKAEIQDSGSLVLHQTKNSAIEIEQQRPEVVELELFTNRFTSIAEKMGEMLQRTALSVNVKERQDFSCALLNPKGELVVNAPHIPVHLGALGVCVRSVIERIEMNPGDVIVTNHPAYGGSHLPDVTVITPIYTPDEELIGYAANRAHHAEVGGMRPGSMPPNATNLAQEGAVISPDYLVKEGQFRIDDIKELLLTAEYPTRSIEENVADLHAQIAANKNGAEALQNLVATHGLQQVHHYMDALKVRASELMRQTIRTIPNGVYEARELLDDSTPLCTRWEIQDESMSIDFEGTGPVHPKNLNATPAIVNSVVMYVLRVLVDQPIPLNEGLLEPVTLHLPECLLNPNFHADPKRCPAVVGGNVEISQRLTDTLLKPFKRIACGQGTMNNVLFGNDSFGYYETVGGGSGAGPDFDGTDGVHQHMTNTKGTDPEIFEQRYPVRLDRYSIRSHSAGDGSRRGGNGIIREMTFLEPVELSVLTQHRKQPPYGQQGGEPGKTGKQWVIRKSGKEVPLGPSDDCDLEAGDRFILHTPGGGGFGKANKKSE